jgi:hypothetical protein
MSETGGDRNWTALARTEALDRNGHPGDAPLPRLSRKVFLIMDRPELACSEKCAIVNGGRGADVLTP